MLKRDEVEEIITDILHHAEKIVDRAEQFQEAMEASKKPVEEKPREIKVVTEKRIIERVNPNERITATKGPFHYVIGDREAEYLAEIFKDAPEQQFNTPRPLTKVVPISEISGPMPTLAINLRNRFTENETAKKEGRPALCTRHLFTNTHFYWIWIGKDNKDFVSQRVLEKRK